MRSTHVLALALGLLAGCKEDKPFPRPPRAHASAAPEEPSARVAPVLSRAFAERDTTLDEQDAPAPAVDLAGEIAAFTDLATCVKRRKPDPLLADGFEALGYENFAWDTCRSVQALKESSVAPCQKMMLSSMRQRCEADVATVTGKAELCPTTEIYPRYRDRAPACLAAARRDTRPCAALGKIERASCEGLVANDPSRCGTDPRCLRRITRMKGLLPPSIGKAPAVTRAVLTVRRKDEQAPNGVREEKIDVSDEAAAGVTVVMRAVGAGIVLGRPTLPPTLAPGQVYVGFLGDLPESAIAGKDGNATVARFYVQLPTGEALELNGGTMLKVRAELWADQVDAPLTLVFSGTTGGAGTPRDISLRVETWVRDRVEREAPK